LHGVKTRPKPVLVPERAEPALGRDTSLTKSDACCASVRLTSSLPVNDSLPGRRRCYQANPYHLNNDEESTANLVQRPTGFQPSSAGLVPCLLPSRRARTIINSLILNERSGAPDTIRTCDLCLRRATVEGLSYRRLQKWTERRQVRLSRWQAWCLLCGYRDPYLATESWEEDS
jgi:hypothetical protein